MKMWTVVRGNVKKNSWYGIVSFVSEPTGLHGPKAIMWFRRKDATVWLDAHKEMRKLGNWVVRPLVVG